jgi:hypothetical protein
MSTGVATLATAPGGPADALLSTGTLSQASLAGLERPVLVAVREGTTAPVDLGAGARERRLSLVIVQLEGGPR